LAAEADESSGRAQIETAIQRYIRLLVRIYVVVEEPEYGRMERMRAAGSGAIISTDGYIVTKPHVAGNAIRMTCTLADGEEVEATRVGTDALSDNLRVEVEDRDPQKARRSLAVAAWGDSSQLKWATWFLRWDARWPSRSPVTRASSAICK